MNEFANIDLAKYNEDGIWMFEEICGHLLLHSISPFTYHGLENSFINMLRSCPGVDRVSLTSSGARYKVYINIAKIFDKEDVLSKLYKVLLERHVRHLESDLADCGDNAPSLKEEYEKYSRKLKVISGDAEIPDPVKPADNEVIAEIKWDLPTDGIFLGLLLANTVFYIIYHFVSK